MRGGEAIERAIDAARRQGRPAISAFLTAGFPSREGFAELLARVAGLADVVEVGVPFSDPLADGVTVQRASDRALRSGVTLDWILGSLPEGAGRGRAPLVLMSYLNPLLSFGWDRVVALASSRGVRGLIVPDLPLEEQTAYRPALDRAGVALIQLVSPVTADARLAELAAASGGFVYAVTVTGVTGGALADYDGVRAYLDRVKRRSPVPVLAGFGVRAAADVERIAPPADGVIVGSALLERLERGENPEAFLGSLRLEGRDR